MHAPRHVRARTGTRGRGQGAEGTRARDRPAPSPTTPPGSTLPSLPCLGSSPVLVLRFSRNKWPLERCWRPKFWAILSHTVPLPEPGGPRMTARRSLEAMALAVAGQDGSPRALPGSPCLSTVRTRRLPCLPPLQGKERHLRLPRPSAPPSATSSGRGRAGEPSQPPPPLPGLPARPFGVRGQSTHPGPSLLPSPGARLREACAGPRTWAEREHLAGRFSVTVASPEWPLPPTGGAHLCPEQPEGTHTSAERTTARLSPDRAGRRRLCPAGRAGLAASYVSREPAPRYRRRAPSSPLPACPGPG